MAQAGAQNTDDSAREQIHAEGYVVDEMQDQALGDVATGLQAIAVICEEARNRHPDLNGKDWAAILRVFGRQVEQVRASAPFTFDAAAQPRDILH